MLDILWLKVRTDLSLGSFNSFDLSEYTLDNTVLISLLQVRDEHRGAAAAGGSGSGDYSSHPKFHMRELVEESHDYRGSFIKFIQDHKDKFGHNNNGDSLQALLMGVGDVDKALETMVSNRRHLSALLEELNSDNNAPLQLMMTMINFKKSVMNRNALNCQELDREITELHQSTRVIMAELVDKVKYVPVLCVYCRDLDPEPKSCYHQKEERLKLIVNELRTQRDQIGHYILDADLDFYMVDEPYTINQIDQICQMVLRTPEFNNVLVPVLEVYGKVTLKSLLLSQIVANKSSKDICFVDYPAWELARINCKICNDSDVMCINCQNEILKSIKEKKKIKEIINKQMRRYLRRLTDAAALPDVEIDQTGLFNGMIEYCEQFMMVEERDKTITGTSYLEIIMKKRLLPGPGNKISSGIHHEDAWLGLVTHNNVKMKAEFKNTSAQRFGYFFTKHKKTQRVGPTSVGLCSNIYQSIQKVLYKAFVPHILYSRDRDINKNTLVSFKGIDIAPEMISPSFGPTLCMVFLPGKAVFEKTIRSTATICEEKGKNIRHWKGLGYINDDCIQELWDTEVRDRYRSQHKVPDLARASIGEKTLGFGMVVFNPDQHTATEYKDDFIHIDEDKIGNIYAMIKKIGDGDRDRDVVLHHQNSAFAGKHKVSKFGGFNSYAWMRNAFLFKIKMKVPSGGVDGKSCYVMIAGMRFDSRDSDDGTTLRERLEASEDFELAAKNLGGWRYEVEGDNNYKWFDETLDTSSNDTRCASLDSSIGSKNDRINIGNIQDDNTSIALCILGPYVTFQEYNSSFGGSPVWYLLNKEQEAFGGFIDSEQPDHEWQKKWQILRANDFPKSTTWENLINWENGCQGGFEEHWPSRVIHGAFTMQELVGCMHHPVSGSGSGAGAGSGAGSGAGAGAGSGAGS